MDLDRHFTVTNPTLFFLGKMVAGAGLILFATALVTWFTGDFFMAPDAWAALAVPVTVVGVIILWNGLARS